MIKIRAFFDIVSNKLRITFVDKRKIITKNIKTIIEKNKSKQ